MAQLGLGVYVDEKILSLACVQRTFRQTVIKSHQTVVLTHTDPNDDARITEISGFISAFCQENKIRSAYTVVSIGWKDFLWSLVEMPPVSRQDLLKLMQYELELHIPVNPDDMYFDALPVGMMSGTQAKVLLITSPKEKIRALQASFQRAGIKLFSVEPAPLSRWRYLMRHEGLSGEESKQVIILGFCDRTEAPIEILIVQNGKPILFRTVSGKDPWGMNGEKALEETNPGIQKLEQRIIDEIRLSLLSIGKSGAVSEIEKVLLTGKCPENLEKALGKLYPEISFRRALLPPDVAGLSFESYSQAKITALGAAYAQPEDDDDINLLPLEDRPVQRHSGLVLTGVLAGFILALGVTGMANDYWKTEVELLKTKANISRLEGTVNRILEINREFDAIKSQYAFFMKMSREYPSALEILRELSRLLPKEDTDSIKMVYLDEFITKGNELTIRGKSESPEGLINLMEDSPYFEKVHFDGSVSENSFRIKATISQLQTVEEAMAEEESAEKESAAKKQPQKTPPTPTPLVMATPTPAGGPGEEISQSEEEPVRGPAFPKNKRKEVDIATPEPQPTEKPPTAPPEEKSEEDLEKMKENLFDFIKKHKEEMSSEEPGAETDMEPPDSEEAANKFLEFLKTVSEEAENMEPEIPEDEQPANEE